MSADSGRDEDLEHALLAHVPEDGSTIGNTRLRRALGEHLGREIDEATYFAAQRALVDDGVLIRGAGRGGSVRRAQPDSDDGLTLEAQEIPEAARRPKPKQDGLPIGKRRRPGVPERPKKDEGGERVIAYRHRDTRPNNPEVGMVTPDNDDADRTSRWAYDPHLSPELRFDVGRAEIETLIDDALASGDADVQRETLETLRRMAAPYLNWAGKAERTSFEVDLVSLHVHERIDPATILGAVRKRMAGTEDEQPANQSDLFRAWFEEPLPYREAIEFYKHDRGWSNRLIAGDSLLVMNSLLEKEGMAGQVQMIYIDPPYGIRYGSNFQPFVNKRDVKDRKDEDLTQEPEMIKAFRDTWELGIHSYLTYLRDRLLLARQLLADSGSVFVQISDENLHHVRELLDELFGPENFVGQIAFVKTSGLLAQTGLTSVYDHLIWVAKDRRQLKSNPLFVERELDASMASQYGIAESKSLKRRRLSANRQLPEGARRLRVDNLTKPGPGSKFEFLNCGVRFQPGVRWWGTTPDGMRRVSRANRLVNNSRSIYYARYWDDFPYRPLSNLWLNSAAGGFAEARIYVVQTSSKVIENCLQLATSPGDLVLDPTCGSGGTALVAEKWGRRWITCDTSRVAITLAKQRLMTASFDYYRLRYPHEGLKAGFDYRTVPHVTLKSIANNPEIDEIWERMHPAVESALAELNDALRADPPAPWTVPEGGRKGDTVDFGASSEASVELPSGESAPAGALLEWEVPFDFPDAWPESARASFDAFHTARIAMQERMDASIAAHADQETLYDQPEVDKDKLRVTGPFTVEAVPFPSVHALDEEPRVAEADESIARSGESARQHAWRDELLKAHVRGKGGQVLRLAELETLPDTETLHCSGTLAETGERVVVSFGPEHAALEQRQVERAMREAGELFPRPKMILFCAFTFDPEAAKDIDATKGITALKVQMNTDLLTEDLKKARASNESFWLMGQPDVDVNRLDDGRFRVEVHGFDYFDTTKGELVSGGKQKIAAWMLDADYDERSLFPQQVFFPMAGGKDGWNKLKRNLRAELDESMLDVLHGTASLPFEAGEHGRVAVKIVDDRGIESLKVLPLPSTGD